VPAGGPAPTADGREAPQARARGPFSGLAALSRTTTFRVAIAFAGLFAGFSLILLGYIYATTVGRLGVEAERGARAELLELRGLWAGQGVVAVNREVISRAVRVSNGLYVLITPDGTVMSGNIDAVPLDLSRVQKPSAGGAPADPVFASFSYFRPNPDTGVLEERQARGWFLAGSDGFGLFVARDLGPGVAIANQVAQVVWSGSAAVLAFALVGGFMAARQAAGRVEELGNTARAVMAGDLSRRAAVRPARPGEGDEFDGLTSEINAMLDRIERLVASARTIGDTVAHDLRSPLTRLRGRLEAAAADGSADADALRDTLDRAVAELDAVVVTFNAVLRLSRLEAGEGARAEPVALSALAGEIADLFEPAVTDAGLLFEDDIQLDLHVLGDRSLLAQALTNLIDNAIKYTGSGTVSVALRRGPSGDVRLSVADTGPGIPTDQRARALERFVRLDSARSTVGTGIGLSLAVAVAEVHGGTLELSDGLGAAAARRADEGDAPAEPGLTATIILPKDRVLPAPSAPSAPSSSLAQG
jgi:signal transduction histidine kinase